MDWPALASCDLCPMGTNGLGSVLSCGLEPNGYTPQPTLDSRVQNPDRASLLTLEARHDPKGLVLLLPLRGRSKSVGGRRWPLSKLGKRRARLLSTRLSLQRAGIGADLRGPK
jgi:hypothetical protein